MNNMCRKERGVKETRKTKPSLLLSILLLTLVLAGTIPFVEAPPKPGRIRIRNKSFEIDKNGDWLPDNWMFAGVSGGYFVNSYLAPPLGGSHRKHCVEIGPLPVPPPAAPYGDYWFQTGIKVRPNKQYSVSVDISTPITPAPAGTPFHWAGIEVHEFNAAGMVVAVSKSVGLFGAGQIPSYPMWTTDTLTFTTTATTVSIEIQLWAAVTLGGMAGIPILFDYAR